MMRVIVAAAGAITDVLPAFGRLGQRRKATHIVVDLVNLIIVITAAAAAADMTAADVGPIGGGGSSQQPIDSRGGGGVVVTPGFLKTEKKRCYRVRGRGRGGWVGGGGWLVRGRG